MTWLNWSSERGTYPSAFPQQSPSQSGFIDDPPYGDALSVVGAGVVQGCCQSMLSQNMSEPVHCKTSLLTSQPPYGVHHQARPSLFRIHRRKARQVRELLQLILSDKWGKERKSGFLSLESERGRWI